MPLKRQHMIAYLDNPANPDEPIELALEIRQKDMIAYDHEVARRRWPNMRAGAMFLYLSLCTFFAAKRTAVFTGDWDEWTEQLISVSGDGADDDDTVPPTPEVPTLD